MPNLIWPRIIWMAQELHVTQFVKSLATATPFSRPIAALAHFWCRLSLYFGGESSTEMTHQGVINLGRTTRARANQLNRHRGFDGSRSDNDTGKPKRRILLLPDLPPAVAKSSQPLQSQACGSSLAGSSGNYRNRGSALSLRQRPLRAKDLRGAITKGRGGTCQAKPSARGYTATHWPGAGGRRRRSPGASHALSASRDTLLRLVRRNAPAAPISAPAIIGIDEFAWKRGQRYGTVV
jgi:hypothetical protein